MPSVAGPLRTAALAGRSPSRVGRVCSAHRLIAAVRTGIPSSSARTASAPPAPASPFAARCPAFPSRPEAGRPSSQTMAARTSSAVDCERNCPSHRTRRSSAQARFRPGSLSNSAGPFAPACRSAAPAAEYHAMSGTAGGSRSLSKIPAASSSSAPGILGGPPAAGRRHGVASKWLDPVNLPSKGNNSGESNQTPSSPFGGERSRWR